MMKPKKDIYCRILVVDDDYHVALMIKAYCKMKNVDIDIAHSCSEAIYQSSLNSYSLIMMDLNLSDGLGTEIIPEIQQSQNDATILLMTGDCQGVASGIMEEMGIQYYLAKPFGIKDLSTAIGLSKQPVQ